MNTSNPYLFQLEPTSLIEAVLKHPPGGFEACSLPLERKKIPAFLTEFDLLITADEPVRRFVQTAACLLPKRLEASLLRPRTLFVGTTVSEFALFPKDIDISKVPRFLLNQMKQNHSQYLIVKDVAPRFPLLSSDESDKADNLCQALLNAGFVALDGQALAYIPIDFTSIDDFFSHFSRSRRADFRRKLKKRSEVTLEIIHTGDSLFSDPLVIDQYYTLYENVYNHSYIHFEKLSRAFFQTVLTDPNSGGLLFTYRQNNRLIGYSLCFQRGDFLIDKYHGAEYPAFRDNNLYYVSWFDMLQYALDHSLSTAVFGWTDPEIKAYLGSNFVFTRHLVYPANAIIRTFLKRFAHTFESDRKTLDDWYAQHAKKKKS